MAPDSRPSILFVCVHNAGRSQMAAAYAHHLSSGRVEVRSAGSAPAESVNPAVREAMLEEGIDISAERPKVLTPEAVRASDVVITMGCGDTCPIYPGRRYLDWVLDDPAGQDVAAVRPIRDEIKARVSALLAELGCCPKVADMASHVFSEDRRGAGLVFVSGQTPLRDDGSVSSKVSEQVRTVLDKIVTRLTANGLGLDDVLKVTYYLTDIDDLQEVRDVLLARLPEPPPAATLVEVAALVDPRFRVEIDAIAAAPFTKASST